MWTTPNRLSISDNDLATARSQLRQIATESRELRRTTRTTAGVIPERYRDRAAYPDENVVHRPGEFLHRPQPQQGTSSQQQQQLPSSSGFQYADSGEEQRLQHDESHNLQSQLSHLENQISSLHITNPFKESMLEEKEKFMQNARFTSTPMKRDPSPHVKFEPGMSTPPPIPPRTLKPTLKSQMSGRPKTPFAEPPPQSIGTPNPFATFGNVQQQRPPTVPVANSMPPPTVDYTNWPNQPQQYQSPWTQWQPPPPPNPNTGYPGPGQMYPSPPPHTYNPYLWYPPPPPPPAIDPALLTQVLTTCHNQNKAILQRTGKYGELRQFDGNPLEWNVIKEHFDRSTRDQEYSSSENLDRLEKALKREAREHVRALIIAREKPEEIMRKLEEQFGRPEYVINSLTASLRNVAPPKETKLATLMPFSNEISNLVATIECLKLPTYLMNPPLIRELQDKLPDSLKLKWGEYIVLHPDSTYNLKTFSTWISTIAQAASRVSQPVFKEDKDSKKKGTRIESSLLVSTSEQPETENKGTQPKKCTHCNKEKHTIAQCRAFRNLKVVERWEVAKEKGLCFKCLLKHGKDQCQGKGCRHCSARHHTLFHGSSRSIVQQLGQKTSSTSNDANAPTATTIPSSVAPAIPGPSNIQKTNGLVQINANLNLVNSVALLRVIPVALYGPNGRIIINAILDDGSQATLVDAEVADELGISGPTDPLRLRWTNGSNQGDSASRRITLRLGPATEKIKYEIRGVRTCKHLSLPAQTFDYNNLSERYPYLGGITFFALPDSPPRMIIGEPHAHLIVSRDIREGREDQPIATRTKLGWMIHGPVPATEQVNSVNTFTLFEEDEAIHQLVKENFTLESIGIRHSSSTRSKEDIEAEKLMKKVTRRVGDRWETGLLWRKIPGEQPPTETNTTDNVPSPATQIPSEFVATPQPGKPLEVPSVPLVERTEEFVPSLQERGGPDCTSAAVLNEGSPCSGSTVGGWPIHSRPLKLPPSRDVAYRRMLYLERKFKRNPELKQQFQQKIRDYLEKGYAKILTPEELSHPSPAEWYLPLFGTYHPNEPGKLRLIWDAASKANGFSLNDFLYTGSDLLVSLIGLLLKFRQRIIALLGDIVDMFHQVLIREEDQPAQRCLWRYDPNLPPVVIQILVMIFGSVCSSYCAQFVKNTNVLEFINQFPEAVLAILIKHYMDDYVDSLDTIAETLKLVKDVTYVHSKGGFKISKWISNSPEVLQAIPEEDRATSMKDLSDWSEIQTERALGLHWNPATDEFTFKINRERIGEALLSGDHVPTKRAILRILMLIWDPLGFLSHFLIPMRILIQHLWRLKLGWDDGIPLTLFKGWQKWLMQLPLVAEVQLQRCFSTIASTSINTQLHIFVDASELAYSAVAYLRFQKDDGVEVSFVLAKARVAPLKATSIPRLELQAALIGARIAHFISRELDIPIHRRFLWSDSMTALHWIRSEARRYQQFVSNRVGEMQELTDVREWRWVPSEENPADEATREGTANLDPEGRWFRGPEFLRSPQDEWPSEPETRNVNNNDEDDHDPELRVQFVGLVLIPVEFTYLPDIQRFSNYNRLVRATAYFLLALKKFKKEKELELPIDKAETLLIRSCQWESYPEEMHRLSREEDIPKRSPLYQLNPMIDGRGILRMKSRLVRSEDENLRLPIILHPKSPLTKLLIMMYHRRLGHGNSSIVLNEIRQIYWIPTGKTAIKSVITTCVYCKIRIVKAIPPQMNPLPEIRIRQPPRPFTYVGVDYFGPMEVVVKRSREKRYGVHFTCLSTRAVHLEIAHALTTASCIMAIRRLIGRRGQPEILLSDNGTNLRGADRELRACLEELNQTRLKDECEYRGIKWNFSCRRSPHMTGAIERMVQSVKKALSNILKSRAPKEEVLQTVFVEAEAIVNSRPLTNVSSDPDFPEALTPFHFLIGSSSVQQVPGIFEDKEAELGDRWRQSQALANLFWKRWRKEYLPTLQKRTKWHSETDNIKVGEVVVLFDESLRLRGWPIGIITATNANSNDGIVRICDIKTNAGKIYGRSVVHKGRLNVFVNDINNIDH